MRCWINVSREALRHNYRFFSELSPNSVAVPVLKSNAYGHGLIETYEALAPLSPSWVAVNYLFEADALRRHGYQGHLLVVGPASPRDLGFAFKINADVLISDELLLETWLANTEKPRAHVKFDTGMSRQGFFPDDAARIAARLGPFKDRVVGVASHFANVEDVTEQGYALKQLAEFERAQAALEAAGFKLKRHIASSASTLIMANSRFDLERIGISLYGLWPSQATRLSYLQINANVATLKPALEWKTEIASVKTVKTGQFIGYGCTFKAVHAMRVAVLPVGYYEGYPRVASNSGSYVLVHGQRCAIVGRICMNMMMVDVTDVEGAKALDEVTLIGNDGNEVLDAATVATWAQTIHYELLTCLNPNIPRRLVD